MASVTSLDADMRNLRLSRYTPQAVNEARAWIESILQTDLPAGDLLDALKDGTILCQLANLAITPQHGAIRWKKSTMPFMQMENISHFLKACEMPPLSLPAHDRFLTVDLFEAKDAAQVLQCLGAFSRQANRINPGAFPTTIGPKKAGAGSFASAQSGSASGSAQPSAATPVSSWSKKSDEGYTAPAWNIHQYGYLGGASQGNQGVTFGARRQITSQAPTVPSLAGKEQARKEKLLAEERQRQQGAEEALQRERAAAEEEERAKQEESRQWEAEAERLREEERKHLEQQKREWDAQERKWQEEEAARRHAETVDTVATSSSRPAILRGQTLAEYQREQAQLSQGPDKAPHAGETADQLRVRELEKELEAAKERERQYQAEREGRLQQEPRSASRPSTAMTQTSQTQSEISWNGDERNYITQQPQNSGERALPQSTHLNGARPLPAKPAATLEEPTSTTSQVAQNEQLPISAPKDVSRAPPQVANASTSVRSPFGRPLPTPRKPDSILAPNPFKPNRTDQYLSSNAAPQELAPRISASNEAGDTSLEQSRDRDVRLASQQKTKAGAWASKSLLEREMERERERQREWETNQQALKDAPRDESQGVGQGQSWDINQYGYTGGDNMNRGSGVGSGINFGGRRQVVGPRPKP